MFQLVTCALSALESLLHIKVPLLKTLTLPLADALPTPNKVLSKLWLLLMSFNLFLSCLFSKSIVQVPLLIPLPIPRPMLLGTSPPCSQSPLYKVPLLIPLPMPRPMPLGINPPDKPPGADSPVPLGSPPDSVQWAAKSELKVLLTVAPEIKTKIK